MTIPSSVDDTLVRDAASGENVKIGGGYYVAQLFIQFAPYDVDPKVGSW